MAENKAKCSVHLAQAERPPLHPKSELMPVKVHVYRVIAELNSGFEKVIQELHNVRRISLFPAETVISMHNLICRLRAQANRAFLKTLHDRETANADQFERLCMESEQQETADATSA